MTDTKVIDEIFRDGYSRSMFSIGEAAELYYRIVEKNEQESLFWLRYIRTPLERINQLM